MRSSYQQQSYTILRTQGGSLYSNALDFTSFQVCLSWLLRTIFSVESSQYFETKMCKYNCNQEEAQPLIPERAARDQHLNRESSSLWNIDKFLLLKKLGNFACKNLQKYIILIQNAAKSMDNWISAIIHEDFCRK
ncbi:hypothetical protein ABPG72_011459 [Tetrahymena utriculariae]